MRISDWSSDVCASDVAGLVDRVGLEQRDVDRAVRVVAVDAGHLDLGQRHVRAAVELMADVPVAGRAGFVARLSGLQPFDGELCHRVRSEEYTSDTQSLTRISSAVFCLHKTNNV